MKHISITFLLCLILSRVSASSVLASTYGFNSINATTAFQAAILSAYDTVIVDLQPTDWNVNPNSFYNVNNKVIIFQPNVKLNAISGAFNATNACLLRLTNCTNIQLIGYGAEFKMNKAEYALLNNSEYRMSISLWSCQNVTIKGMTLNESGGDGVYIHEYLRHRL